MRLLITLSTLCCSFLISTATCLAQMYTVMDLGSLGASSSYPRGINVFGQVVGYSDITSDPLPSEPSARRLTVPSIPLLMT